MHLRWIVLRVVFFFPVISIHHVSVDISPEIVSVIRSNMWTHVCIVLTWAFRSLSRLKSIRCEIRRTRLLKNLLTSHARRFNRGRLLEALKFKQNILTKVSCRIMLLTQSSHWSRVSSSSEAISWGDVYSVLLLEITFNYLRSAWNRHLSVKASCWRHA